MRGRTLAAQLVVWIGAIVALNVLIARLTVNALPRQLVRAIDGATHVTDLVAGNSLMAAAVDARELERLQPGSRVLNVALGSSSPVEHDLLIRRAMRLTPERVLYGFFDTQLTRPMPNRLSDLTGTRAMIFYVDREEAIRLLGSDGPPAWQIRLASLVPMYVERATLWGVVERMRRSLASIGSPRQATGRFGRIADFADLEDDPQAFRDHCTAVVARRLPLLPAVDDMFETVRRGHAQALVVLAPMTSRHRRSYYEMSEWSAYVGYLRVELAARGATYVDASAWIPDEEFEDAVHVSERGALEFTRRLAGVLDGVGNGVRTRDFRSHSPALYH
jgi:hypothetical protein